MYLEISLRTPRLTSSIASFMPPVFLAGIRNKTPHFSMVSMHCMPKNPLSSRYSRGRRCRLDTDENMLSKHELRLRFFSMRSIATVGANVSETTFAVIMWTKCDVPPLGLPPVTLSPAASLFPVNGLACPSMAIMQYLASMPLRTAARTIPASIFLHSFSIFSMVGDPSLPKAHCDVGMSDVFLVFSAVRARRCKRPPCSRTCMSAWPLSRLSRASRCSG